MKATAVASMGLIQATCSFHSIAKSCQSAVPLSASSLDFALVGMSSRYHGYTIQVPVITVSHAATAIGHDPDLEPAHAFGDSRRGHELGPQAVKTREPACECEQEESAEPHSVDETPPLTVREAHVGPLFESRVR